MTVKIRAKGVEGHRIELEPSSFAQGVLKVCTIPIFNRFTPKFFLFPITPYPFENECLFGAQATFIDRI